MEGYFTLKVKFMIAVLLAALIYVTYLYFFKEQTPDPFQLRENCTEAEVLVGTAKAKRFFERYANKLLQQNPKLKEQPNSKKMPWTVLTEEDYREKYRFHRETLTYLNDSILLSECLDKPTQLNAQLLKQELKTAIKGYAYRYYNYPINAYDGVQNQLSIDLKNHLITNESEAQDYITKVEGAKGQLERLIKQLEIRAAKNIILPKHLFPEILASIQGEITKNATQQPNSSNSISTDFNQKIKQLDLKEESKIALMDQLLAAINQYWVPAYQQLFNYLTTLETKATREIGVWKFEEGMAFYKYKLQEQIRTTLMIDEVFQLGTDEVERIHQEMQEKMNELDFEGNLMEFFNFIQTDKQFYYSNNEEGKKAYLEKVKHVVEAFKPELNDLFSFEPTTKLLIEGTETSQPKTDQPAFYQRVERDKTDFGIYYVNTKDMGLLPKFKLEALAYHNAIPGAHVQASVEEGQLKDLPRFRYLTTPPRVYQEGWNLYAEYLPKEMNYYQNTYADVGRLTNELWWTCALVVDIGIHCYEWSQQQAIEYYQKNCPSTRTNTVQMVDRQIVNPAQAIAAKMGMITLLELKGKAQEALGEQFDRKSFHDVLLSNGAVPLDILQDLVEYYIDERVKVE